VARGADRAYASVEVIRPAALLSEQAAREILAGLAADDVRAGGHWSARPGVWQRFAAPWAPDGEPAEPPGPGHLGTISCIYDSPRRYTVTVFRVSVTPLGAEQGWTVRSLCDEAFGHAALTLDSCPRVPMEPAPRPFTA
jgi:hypothetical protein